VFQRSWWLRGHGPLDAQASVPVLQAKSMPSRVPLTSTCLPSAPQAPSDGLLTIQPPVNLGNPGASWPWASTARMSASAEPWTTYGPEEFPPTSATIGWTKNCRSPITWGNAGWYSPVVGCVTRRYICIRYIRCRSMPAPPATTAAGPAIPGSATTLARLAGRFRRAVNRRVRAEVGGTPLPEAQLDVLRAVAAAERPPRIQDVAASLRLAPNTVSTLVAALADRGLLDREVDSADGRAVRLAPTAQARRRMATWQAHRSGVVQAHLERLTDAQRRSLERALPALEQLVASLEAFDA
jgi:DNA-binding MarR family transcriptional regulator